MVACEQLVASAEAKPKPDTFTDQKRRHRCHDITHLRPTSLLLVVDCSVNKAVVQRVSRTREDIQRESTQPTIDILPQPASHYLWKQKSPSVPLIAGYLREKEGRMCDQFSDSHGGETRERAESGVCDSNTLRWLMVGSIWERSSGPNRNNRSSRGAPEKPCSAGL